MLILDEQKLFLLVFHLLFQDFLNIQYLFLITIGFSLSHMCTIQFFVWSYCIATSLEQQIATVITGILALFLSLTHIYYNLTKSKPPLQQPGQLLSSSHWSAHGDRLVSHDAACPIFAQLCLRISSFAQSFILTQSSCVPAVSPSRDTPLLTGPQLWKETPYLTLCPPIWGENGFLRRSKEAEHQGKGVVKNLPAHSFSACY